MNVRSEVISLMDRKENATRSFPFLLSDAITRDVIRARHDAITRSQPFRSALSCRG
jgi:hypothetical protein